MIKPALLFLLLVFSFRSIAQDADTLTRKEKREIKKNAPPAKGDLYLLLVPTISYNPSYGLMYGVGATASSYLGDPKTTSISSALAGANYTTLNQLIINVRSNIYTENNNYIFNGDWRYMDTSQPTYGLGTGPSTAKLASDGFEISEGITSAPVNEAQQMTYKLFRIYQTISRKIDSTLYVGIGYHLDIYDDIDDQLLDLDAQPPVITSTYGYNHKYGFDQNKSIMSGASMNVSFDTRDNQNDPFKGEYVNLQYKLNNEFLGSDFNSTLLWLEFRKYLDLTKNQKNMLCFWAYTNLTLTGKVPYLNLPALGWDQFGRSGRGYIQGRFRGQNLIYLEAEWRHSLYSSRRVQNLLGMVLFTNFTTASNTDAGIKLAEYVDPAGGIGLDIMALPKARTSVGIDYGIGKYGSDGIYIRLNKAF